MIALVAASHAHAQPACRVSIDASVSFGSYNVLSQTPLDTTGQISWRCPGNLPQAVQITITRGQNGDAVSRRLAQGGEFLRYDLYLDSARTQVWGDGTYGAWHTAVYPGGGWIPLTIYARIFKEQDVAAGAYTDAVTVVVNF